MYIMSLIRNSILKLNNVTWRERRHGGAILERSFLLERNNVTKVIKQRNNKKIWDMADVWIHAPSFDVAMLAWLGSSANIKSSAST